MFIAMFLLISFITPPFCFDDFYIIKRFKKITKRFNFLIDNSIKLNYGNPQGDGKEVNKKWIS